MDEGTFFRKALEQRKSIFITDEQQIIEVLKEHNTNPKIKSFNTWANSFQKIKTFVILPLVLDDVIFGLITATYKKVLSNYERERLIRFTKSTVAILDKAEKKRKLKEQKEFTEKILNTIPADIVIFDRNKRYAFINKFADLKNNRRECLLGKSIQDLVHEKELPKVKADSIDQNISLVQKSKQRVDWIDEVDTDKNTKKFILRSLYPLLENNEITQYLGFGVDITEQINSKKTIEKTLEESDKLQSMVLSSQMNPHFIFNCLNSLQYYILNNKEEDTLTYIALFSNLMRQSLENSDNFKISLEREIDFIKKYLDLQKSRYDGKIDYSISIDTSVNSSEVEIPPMFIQPYIENALFHGLAHKEDKGFVKIGLYINKSGFLLCKITDNGIGREKSKVLNEMNKKKQVSKGMRITEQRLEILRRIFDVNYSVEIIDKKNKKGQATGTEVILVIPQ